MTSSSGGPRGASGGGNPTATGQPQGSQTTLPALPIHAATSLSPGDIVIIDMPQAHIVGSEQEKRRPWVVTSHPRILQAKLGLVHAVPLSKQVHKLVPTYRVLVEPDDIQIEDPTGKLLDPGIKRIALCEQARALSEFRVLAVPGRLRNKRILSDIRAGVAFVNGS